MVGSRTMAPCGCGEGAVCSHGPLQVRGGGDEGGVEALACSDRDWARQCIDPCSPSPMTFWNDPAVLSPFLLCAPPSDIMGKMRLAYVPREGGGLSYQTLFPVHHVLPTRPPPPPPRPNPSRWQGMSPARSSPRFRSPRACFWWSVRTTTCRECAFASTSPASTSARTEAARTESTRRCAATKSSSAPPSPLPNRCGPSSRACVATVEVWMCCTPRTLPPTDGASACNPTPPTRRLPSSPT